MITNSTKIHIKVTFRDHKIKELCQFSFQVFLMFAKSVPTYHSAAWVVGSS